MKKEKRIKVGIYCTDIVGKAMAGPAIRYWEFAKELSKKFDVTLFSPYPSEVQLSSFSQIPHYNKIPSALMEMDLIITQSVNCQMAIQAKKSRVKIILDAFDPEPLEVMEIFKRHPMHKREIKSQQIRENHLLSFRMADGFICASEKQKDLWIGSLLSLGRITPQIYDADNSLRNLIAIVPFGLSSQPPIQAGEGLRKRFNLSKMDKVILWGGGIWNWFDPLTLIRAIKLLCEERADIKLVFMGLKHPNEAIPEMKMATQAINLAKDLELIDRHIFFNYDWVPYAERQNFLLEADVGVSTHLDHLETRYSFRTRMLDYLWAQLPIIGTEGDSFAELIQANHLGIVVPFNDSQAIAQAIKQIVDSSSLRETMKNNLKKMQSCFYWENAILPIEKMIENLVLESSSKGKTGHLGKILNSMLKRIKLTYQEKGLFALLKHLISKIRT